MQPSRTAHGRARPILVTGSHRSGTTWVGQVLSLSREALAVHEPFNARLDRSWLSEPAPCWYWYIAPDEPGPYEQVKRVMELRPPAIAMARRADKPRGLVGVARDVTTASWARFRGRRTIVKDPLAFFSAEWLATRFDTLNVVLVRHPAAFASSLKRLDWRFDFRNLTQQPALMARFVGSDAEAVERAARQPPDVLAQAILLWRVINRVALRYQAEHPDWLVLRYEDLAAAPFDRFADLYARLGLDWSPSVESHLRALTDPRTPEDPRPGDRGGVRRRSADAMWSWQDRLTAAEIATIRAQTADVAGQLYHDADWTPDGER